MNTTYSRQRILRVIQVIGLFVALLLERTVGLPIIFLGITLQTIDLSNNLVKRLVIVTAAIVLAVVYQFSLLASIVVIGLGIVSWFVLQEVSSSKTVSLLLSTAIMVGTLVVYVDIDLTVRVLLYSFISTVVVMGIVRTTRSYR